MAAVDKSRLESLQTTTIRLTSAQMQALSSSKVQVIAAPGQNKHIIPVFAVVTVFVNGAAFTDNVGDMSFYWGNSTITPLSFGTADFSANSSSAFVFEYPLSGAGTALASSNNQPIKVGNDGGNGTDVTGGNGNVVEVTLGYHILDSTLSSSSN